MRFSTKTRYGMRAMLEIASDISQRGVFQKDIAEKQQISVKYLDQIIHALKSEGLIINVRGKKSGYILARKPSEITMLDIHKAFEPGICVIDCCSDSYNCQMKEFCRTVGFWMNLNKLVIDYFSNTTLQDLLKNPSLAD
ncbi:RrF2 family transcriptional regulator [Gaoshiqia sediminis]|uniref:Rrf2 family transcriptional regulator n=1 Tax=Gaoshiqia sediminis TaxID=2986998 RepID=A0AA41Y4D8_9BACT|nr:Rrf2 family transcriptional regulator [Gaoshiqia sediminis]MCW0481301.1 Rrf2 family transcriptional regulator [Gaoshiqia sediminis]